MSGTNALTIRLSDEDEQNLAKVAKLAAHKHGTPFINRSRALRYALACTAETAPEEGRE
jgi:hypothetical protein